MPEISVILFLILWTVLAASSTLILLRMPRLDRSGSTVAVFGVICGATLFFEPSGYRTVMDELLTVGIAMNIAEEFNPNATVVRFTHPDVTEHLEIDLQDKRPLTWPTAGAVWTFFTGSNPDSLFLLQRLSAVFLVPLLSLFAYQIGGVVSGLMASVLLIANPLFRYHSSGFGLELPTALLTAYISLILSISPTLNSRILKIAFGSAVILLALVRYESLVLALPFGLYLFKKLAFKGRLIFSIAATLSMVELSRILIFFESSPGAWEIANPENTPPFSPEYAIRNAINALHWFFLPSPLVLNQPTLSIAALGGFLILITRFFRSDSTASMARIRPATICLASASILYLAVLLTYFWGDLTDPIIYRLGIPFLPVLVMGMALLFRQFRDRATRALLVVSLILSILPSIPKIIGGDHYRIHLSAHELNLARAYAHEIRRENPLILAEASFFWINEGIDSTPTRWMLKELIHDRIRDRLDRPTSGPVILIQRVDAAGIPKNIGQTPPIQLQGKVIHEIVAGPENRLRAILVRSADFPDKSTNP